MTSAEYHAAVMAYRTAVGSGPLKTTLQTTALAITEARYQLMIAGDPDQKLLDDLQSVMVRLQAASEATRTQGP